MSLFNLSDLKKEKPVADVIKAVRTKEKIRLVIGKANQKLEEVIGTINQGECISYSSYGDWSTHDLLFYLLQTTGPAKVYFTTWAISEYAVRQLYNFIQQGHILELHGIFDYRNGVRKPAELQFLQKITTNIKPAKCHAKVTCIINDSWSIAIVGSANYTRNPRIEAGDIHTDPKVAEHHRYWIIKELNEQSVF